jgi:hypothetical protein
VELDNQRQVVGLRRVVPEPKRWCIQDASGRCLAHCDAIHGQDVDAQTAVKLAKAMIRDGRMPTPEEANAQLALRLRMEQQLVHDEWLERMEDDQRLHEIERLHEK